jgi:hypothetical protein
MALKKEVIRLKRELKAVSAQDDFAKWAKLDRQHGKAMADFQKLGMYSAYPQPCPQSLCLSHREPSFIPIRHIFKITED